jgi:proteasome lid subunit RPN8/RPN11
MLRLNKSTVQALIREAATQPDREVCGLVWGSEGLRAQTVSPLRNIHSEPDRYYRTDPLEIKEVFDAMDLEGGSPIAWYHSHPSGKPDPSETDMAGAFDSEMLYVILYPDRELHSKMAGEAFGEEAPWRLSVWECLSPGVLVQSSYEIAR